ncbi:Txe/YoeB family addiction module toxin [Weeksellaceae bacterium TAE3-ERU29]|nr:Txe/YoeB family addiction module toxin [Weeksellaceae bacterium TAE3-ERU29]
MSYEIEITEIAIKGVKKHKKSGNKTLLKKINNLITALEENPYQGKGKPEELRGYGERFVLSRRIDVKHRLVYEVFENKKQIVILSVYGHYDNK